MTRREVWRDEIEAEDYERHMAAVGQAEANAGLIAELLRDHPPPSGALLLCAGAGTGQCFDYLPLDLLLPYRTTFTDINPGYLDRLSLRVHGLDFATAVDDIEQSQLAGPFDLAIVVLVLEHVDWRKAVAGLARQAARVFTVIQQDPADAAHRTLPGTMAKLREFLSALVDRAELIAEFEGHGFELCRTSLREVADGKTMAALDFKLRR